MTALIIELMPPMHLDAGMNNSNSIIAIGPDIPILGVSGNSCGSNIGLMCALS